MLRHSTGQARVILSGKTHYLGKWGTPEAHAKYAALVKAWEENGRQSAAPVATVVDVRFKVADLFREYGRYLDDTGRYSKNGKSTSQRQLIDVALRELEALFGEVRVDRFGEEHLLQHRDRLESKPSLTRGGINRKTNLIKGAFRWGRQRGMVSKPVWLDLKAVEPLSRSECGGRPEGKPKKPVAWSQLEAVLPFCSRQIGAMLRLEWATGMRPGEVCAMRWADIDQTPVTVDGVACWTYRVAEAKTMHHGHDTVYPLNPTCQAILREFLKAPAAYIFSPRDVMEEWSRQRRENRETPVWPCTLRRDAKRGEQQYGDRYDTAAYRQAVERACKRAGVERFTPHAIRHSFVTRWANDPRFGAAAAGAAVNHRNRQTTDTYVHADRSLAYRIAVAAEGEA